MRFKLTLLAALAATACAPAQTSTTPATAASGKPASAAPGAQPSPPASGAFEAVKRFESDAYSAKFDGKAVTMLPTVDRVVPAGTTHMVALTLGVAPARVLAAGEFQMVFSIVGKDKHAATADFTTADLKTATWQFFEGTGGFTPKAWWIDGAVETETYTFSGGKMSLTLKTMVKNPVDFTGKEPKKSLEVTIKDLPLN